MKTIRTLLTCSLIALSLFLSNPASAEEEFEPTPVEHYREQGVSVALPDQWPPFSFTDTSGNRVGYLVELWTAWGEASGVPFTLVYVTPESAEEGMREKKYDVYGGVRHTEDRAEFMDFADSLYSSTTVLAIKKDGPIDCSNAMSGNEVGVIDGSRFHQAFAGKYPDAMAKPFPSATAVARAFMEGKINAAAIGYTPLIRAARENGEDESLNICRTVYYDEIYAAVQKEEENLLELIEEGMESISAETMAGIEGNWFEKQERYSLDWRSSVLPAAIALALVCVGVMLFRRRGQRR